MTIIPMPSWRHFMFRLWWAKDGPLDILSRSVHLKSSSSLICFALPFLIGTQYTSARFNRSVPGGLVLNIWEPRHKINFWFVVLSPHKYSLGKNLSILNVPSLAQMTKGTDMVHDVHFSPIMVPYVPVILWFKNQLSNIPNIPAINHH